MEIEYMKEREREKEYRQREYKETIEINTERGN